MPDMEELQGELGADKDELDACIEFADNFRAFYNINKGNVTARLDRYKKPLNTVTKADLDSKFTCDISPERAAAILKVLDVMHAMTQVKILIDNLPANNKN